ncbi:HesA/MoeB/ThiF family protein [Sphingomonas sp. BN140010]|uniref:HesA/MoeB/ThiF family protein n=1 Tax=Sphingomonas arvum TaxID=2992113 RepID=A0ABT3JIH4_9SPHN|nr:HesA/MoeB/ThiF family protein [Sphingomonas sp. BN140010]MCW3798852.1 HesA/MoeB/ThiF family protein [Sphingomonas sp. BN140010]
MSLKDEELARYSRQIVLPQFGGVGQQRLKAASVCVVGAGGIGCAVIPALAGAGLGHLTVIDGDILDLSNLHRQPLYRSREVGEPKAALAGQFVRRLNPFTDVNPVEHRITGDNASDLLTGHDLILDGTDNFATRLVVSDTAVRLGIPLVSAAAVQFQGQLGLFRGAPCYRCFVGDAFDSDDCDTCAELGVLGALTGTVGNAAALLAIRALAQVGDDPAGKLHLFDGLTGEWRIMRLPADPACRACGT